ncbi:hypothetical protein FisN_24Lu227 [Fistulifera solaris]|uniref:Uncharacterized protein n=1 Tax=Fistulifera solaris TaxID=1519565 RepID=A0A1Z5K9G5_FISSO|nr:hypothetical protein FisN_24Lu227 [Fistulifera solaris]|eukprot:GAX22887.1 hypothetical protein FisN_24Lu227 [Fistulifera solaris]
MSRNNDNDQRDFDGRFTTLTLEDDEEDEVIDWDAVHRAVEDGSLLKYAGVTEEEEIDINDALLNGDDRFQAMALLSTMEDLMGAIKEQHGRLKECMNQSSSCMKLLLECAVFTNLAVDSINRAENELALEHPHISSFYHVLAIVFLTDSVAKINQLMDKALRKKHPHMALEFVAKITEYSFLRKDHVSNKAFSAAVNRFVKKSGLDLQYVANTVDEISGSTSIEVLTYMEMMQKDGLKATEADTHLWLGQCENIGGDYCILNTQKLL